MPPWVCNGVYHTVCLPVYVTVMRDLQRREASFLWENGETSAQSPLLLSKAIPVSLLASSPVSQVIPVSLLVEEPASLRTTRFTGGREESLPYVSRFTVGQERGYDGRRRIPWS